jgi:hypothetical protein
MEILGSVALWLAFPSLGAAEPKLTLHEAYYRPDAVEYSWELGGVQSAGSIHLYLKNVSADPVEIRDVRLLGSTARRLVAAPLPMANRRVNWFRIVPNPVGPGQIANVLIRLAREPAERHLNLAVETDDGQSVDVSVSLRRPDLSLSYVSWAQDFTTVYAYVRKDVPDTRPIGQMPVPNEGARPGFAITKVLFDGHDVTGRCFIPDPRFFHGLALVKIGLENPVGEGSVHTIKVEVGAFASTAYQVRAVRPLFVVGSYWVPPAEEGYNLALSFAQAPKEFLDIVAGKGLVGGGDYFPAHGQTEWDRASLGQYLTSLTDHPALHLLYLDDEPDCRDFEYAGEKRAELGYTAMSMVRKMEFLREVCPKHPTFIAIDNTWRPANYFVYGELADIMAPHWYGDEISYCAGQSAQVKRAVAPRAAWYTPWLDSQKRPQTPDDMRLRVYYPISEGMKGILYYSWKFAATTTPDKGTDLRAAMTDMHRELQAVGPLLIKGELLPVASSDLRELKLSAFLCADEAVVLVVINENRNDFRQSDTHADDTGNSKGKLREVLPTRNVRIDLDLPPWFAPKEVYEVIGGRTEPVNHSVTSPGLSLAFPEIGLTKMVVIRRDAEKAARTIQLSEGSGDKCFYLNDLRPDRVKSTSFMLNRTAQRRPITLDGKAYPRGIVMAAPGEVIYPLAKTYRCFEALIGMDVADLQENEALKQALLQLPPSEAHRRAYFQVYVDGQRKYDSGLMTLQDKLRVVRVDVSYADELRLVLNEEITPGGDFGIWAEARLRKD